MTLEQARQAVAEGVKQGRRKVILQADGEVPHGEVIDVAAAVAQVEGDHRPRRRSGTRRPTLTASNGARAISQPPAQFRRQPARNKTRGFV